MTKYKSLLGSVLPLGILRERFPNLTLIELGRKQMPAITALKPQAMHSMGLSIWDQIFSRGRDNVQQDAIAACVDDQDPLLCQRIRNIIGKPVIFDIHYALATLVVDGENRTVAETLIAHVYPNEIHVGDIEFSNPYNPIPASERQFEHTHYRGLGLLGNFIERVNTAAKSLGCDRITLTAASRDQLPLFQRHGFTFADTLAGRFGATQGMHISGMSFALERAIQ
jgi:hypothetical protein